MSESDRIPLMFRAQIEGRSQIQRLIPNQARQQADDWVDQWLAGTTDEMPKFGPDVRTRDYQIVWRIVSNGGQDDGAIRLMKFALLLGGFGKSWRRVDHRIVMPSYVAHNSNPPIGCHWELMEASKALYVTVDDLDDIRVFLKTLQSKVKGWVKLKKKRLSSTPADWREAWHPDKVQVWGRLASSKSDSKAVQWFHGSYLGSKSIKKTLLTGWLSQIGRTWHRMYPRYIKTKNGQIQATGEYIELLTIFPDDSDKTQEFLDFLETDSSFSLIYPNSAQAI